MIQRFAKHIAALSAFMLLLAFWVPVASALCVIACEEAPAEGMASHCEMDVPSSCCEDEAPSEGINAMTGAADLTCPMCEHAATDTPATPIATVPESAAVDFFARVVKSSTADAQCLVNRQVATSLQLPPSNLLSRLSVMRC